MKGPNLFNEFPETSAKAWKQKIQFDLKGADYNKTLVWESPEGIKVKPFYTADDVAVISSQENLNSNTWQIGQTIYAGNAVMANKKAKKTIAKGVSCVQFIVPSESVSVQLLLEEIDLQKIKVCLELKFLSESYVKSIKDISVNREHSVYILVDIIGNLAASGNWFYNLKRDHEIVERLLDSGTLQFLTINLALYENAGCHCTQQLGYAMAHATEYLEKYHKNKGLNQLKGFVFNVAVGSNYFFEIAKIRALRWLWKTITAFYELEIPCFIMATPTRRNKTLYDYNVNMLRTTSECMSAILGGSDMVFNLPYDAIYHKDNDFAERMALNQLLILKEESYFDKVDNPVTGSYFVESLTKQLAEKGLQLFKSIESGGGFLKQLKQHTIQAKIKDSARKEEDKFNALEKVLVGTNTYQNNLDQMKSELELYPFVKTKARKTIIEPIIEKRLAEALEQERLGNE
jgi:methylmalonyl-CoA mutase